MKTHLYRDSENKANRPPLAGNSKSETSRACADDFVKQTQFMMDLIDRTSCLEKEYDDIDHLETAGNKPNFESPYPPERPKIERGERFCADEETIRSATSP